MKNENKKSISENKLHLWFEIFCKKDMLFKAFKFDNLMLFVLFGNGMLPREAQKVIVLIASFIF